MQLKSLYLALTLTAFTLPTFAEPQAKASAPANPTPASAMPGPAAAPVKVDPNAPVARVNGAVLSAVHLNLLREERMVRGQQGPRGNDDQMLDSLINAEIMAQEAVKLGLDKPATVQAALDLNRKELLGRALVEDYIAKHPVAEERIKAEYDKAKEKAGGTEYHARHILVPTEKEARDITAKLKSKKAKFEDLAKKHSKDSSAQSGGDLGWMSPAGLVPEFSEPMVKLKKGEFSQAPVKSRFGWHVIKLEDMRPSVFMEYDKVKNRIGQQLSQQDIRKYIAELRATSKVEIPNPAPAAKAETASGAPATPPAVK